MALNSPKLVQWLILRRCGRFCCGDGREKCWLDFIILVFNLYVVQITKLMKRKINLACRCRRFHSFNSLFDVIYSKSWSLNMRHLFCKLLKIMPILKKMMLAGCEHKTISLLQTLATNKNQSCCCLLLYRIDRSELADVALHKTHSKPCLRAEQIISIISNRSISFRES